MNWAMKSLICGISMSTTLLCQNEIKLIESIKTDGSRLDIIINQEFKNEYLEDHFFAEYAPDINLKQFDYSILSMPLIMNVITLIWISGNTYYVDEMDTELFYSLERVKEVFKVLFPKTRWNGQLHAKKLVDHTLPMERAKNKYAVLFSGGIDSTSTALSHADKKLLFITAWGHSDLRLTKPEVWQTRKRRIDRFAHKLGAKTSFIRSNYLYFLKLKHLNTLSPEIRKWRLSAVEGLGWAGLTAPLLFTKGYPILLIASSHTWLYPYPSAANPFIDDNLYYCGIRVIHDQFEMTRLAKTEFITERCKEKNIHNLFLKVCTVEKEHDSNCCKCRKCLTTIAGLIACGKNPHAYGFPLNTSLALKRINNLLRPLELNYYTILYFKGVQRKIRLRIARGEMLPEDLKSLLTINLDNKHAFDVQKQTKIDWRELHKFLPEITIPHTIDEEPCFNL